MAGERVKLGVFWPPKQAVTTAKGSELLGEGFLEEGGKRGKSISVWRLRDKQGRDYFSIVESRPNPNARAEQGGGGPEF